MAQQMAPGFGPPLIGQAEKALNAILRRELEGSGLSQRAWELIAVVAAGPGGSRSELVDRAGFVLKAPAEEVDDQVGRLLGRGLLTARGGDIELTAAARELREGVGRGIAAITARLWGDLPAEDLAAAGRVLGTVLSRANAELGYSI